MMKLKASIYAGHKASFVRFHTTSRQYKGLPVAILGGLFSPGYLPLAWMTSIWSMMLFMRATIA